VPRGVAQLQAAGVGAVEAGVQAELEGLAAAESHPALVQVALALGRVLDGRIPTPKPQAAGKLMVVLDKLHKGSELRGARLSVVRQMSTPDGP
jgi:hypothetical protein